ncbi:protein SuhB [Neisseria gonorrhoeae]|uniref:Protein SuhB n=1 Tax=Neisseria gonorrhoeae TaxID=485 RepID=A0A378VYB9_NEIGO|nr:protein SuhB [Neisseria gonorrhoeae]
MDLCAVATGRFDGFFEFNLKPWDIAAGALIVQEAGGIVTDMSGEDAWLESGDIVAANPKVLAQMLKSFPHTFKFQPAPGNAGKRAGMPSEVSCRYFRRHFYWRRGRKAETVKCPKLPGMEIRIWLNGEPCAICPFSFNCLKAVCWNLNRLWQKTDTGE